MNWKATTAVTGVTTLAGWLMNSWLWTATPTTGAAPDRREARELNEIVREAERLHRGITDVAPFARPTRNPFRFGVRPVPAARPEPTPADLLPPPEPPPPLPPPIALVAIASDTVDGALQRTALLNTRQGIVLAKEGEIVGDYRVRTIDDEGVELVSTLDESVRRLAVR
jgi:hypothetical protein